MPTPEQKLLTLQDGTSIPVEFLGNAALLEHRKVAFLCSTRCAPDRILPAHDKARALRDASVTVASAFQTPIEQDARDILLRGTAPLIWCRPRGIAALKLQPPWRVPFEEGRVLILTFSPGAPPRATRDQSLHNTRCLLNFAEETYIAHATPGGALEKEIISPPEPLDMGAPLAPEEEWTALCNEGDGCDQL
jgi:hypothetical protein